MKRHANRKLALKLLLVSASTFVFGVFVMPPLYDTFCEITGIGQAGVRVASEAPPGEGTQREVRIWLDANSNSALPWEFAPLERQLTVRLGEAAVTHYAVQSLADVPTSGRAVYNVTPPEAARHFVKVECFCFTRQSLAAGEQRDMPVRFYVDRELPANIDELTLSYTFFLNTEQAAATPNPRGAEPVPN
jgi:cytochrome c oxidase assembly protein subunit 11